MAFRFFQRRRPLSFGASRWIIRSTRAKNISTLSFEEISFCPNETTPTKTAMFIHGLLGSGRNWRNFARMLGSALLSQSESAGWNMVLVDLRNHGKSAAVEGFEPPHDIPSAAKDIAQLIQARPELQPDVVIGHSLGGKVVLEFGKSCAAKLYDGVDLPTQLWVLDSVPGKVPINNEEGDVEKVLRTVQSLPDVIPSRRWLVEHIVKLGFSKSLADWLGSNLKQLTPSSEECTWVFNVNGAYDMFASYRELSYWPLLEEAPHNTLIGIVRASKSDRWTDDVILQLDDITRRPRITYHVLENAGHWLHVENPIGLVKILAPSLVK